MCDGAGAQPPQRCSGCSVENQGPNSIICVCFVTLVALRGACSSPALLPFPAAVPGGSAACPGCSPALTVSLSPECSWLRRSWSSAEGPSSPVAVPWLCWEGTAVLTPQLCLSVLTPLAPCLPCAALGSSRCAQPSPWQGSGQGCPLPAHPPRAPPALFIQLSQCAEVQKSKLAPERP